MMTRRRSGRQQGGVAAEALASGNWQRSTSQKSSVFVRGGTSTLGEAWVAACPSTRGGPSPWGLGWSWGPVTEEASKCGPTSTSVTGVYGWWSPGGRKAGQPQQLATWAPIPAAGRQGAHRERRHFPKATEVVGYAVSSRNPLGLTTPPPQRLHSHRPRLPVGRWLGPRTHGMNSTAAPTRWVMT